MPNYGVSLDGQRFLMMRRSGGSVIRIVLDWFQELQRLVPSP